MSKTVSLVLGSGGARGWVQLGVIDWLLANDYKIVAISGCSIGSVVGGLYAAGKYDEFKEWVFALDKRSVIKLVDIYWGAGGLIKGERVMNALKTLVGECEIESLPLQYTAVATDLQKGQEFWFQSGDLFDAIRASVAIPNLLSPHVVNGKVFVDGGVLNPVPIAPTLSQHADLTIAVDLAAINSFELDVREPEPHKNEDFSNKITKFISNLVGDDGVSSEVELPSSIEISNRSFDIMQTTIARMKIAAHTPDVVVEFPRDLAKVHEFWRGEELCKLGFEVMQSTMDRYDESQALL